MTAPLGLVALPPEWRPELADDDPRRTGIDAEMARRHGDHSAAIATGKTTVATVRRRAFIDINMAAADREFDDQVAMLVATEHERDAWVALANFNRAAAPTLPSGTDRCSLAAAGIRHRRAKRELIDAAPESGFVP